MGKRGSASRCGDGLCSGIKQCKSRRNQFNVSVSCSQERARTQQDSSSSEGHSSWRSMPAGDVHCYEIAFYLPRTTLGALLRIAQANSERLRAAPGSSLGYVTALRGTCLGSAIAMATDKAPKNIYTQADLRSSDGLPLASTTIPAIARLVSAPVTMCPELATQRSGGAFMFRPIKRERLSQVVNTVSSGTGHH